MATKTTCDGTGVEIPSDTPVTGMFGHQYCEASRVVAESYLSDLNTLHTEMAQQFQTRLDELRSIYHEKLKELPDEP